MNNNIYSLDLFGDIKQTYYLCRRKPVNVDRETHRFLHFTEGNCQLKAGYQPQRRRKDQLAELHGYHRGGQSQDERKITEAKQSSNLTL